MFHRGLSTVKAVPWTCQAGEGAILLRFGNEIDLAVSENVLAYMSLLDKSTKPEGVTEVLPAYASLLVHFDPLKISAEKVEAWCHQAAAGSANATATAEAREVTIPVVYGGEYGPDIAEVAKITGLASTDAVLKMHADGDYRVYFLGLPNPNPNPNPNWFS